MSTSTSDIQRILAETRAMGEIQNIPPPQLDPILAKLKDELTPGQIPPPP